MSTTLTAPDLAGFTPTQIRKAKQLIADGGVIPTGFPREFITVSSDGTTHYLTAEDACQCRGSMHGTQIARCYHQAGVRIYLAAQEDASCVSP